MGDENAVGLLLGRAYVTATVDEANVLAVLVDGHFGNGRMPGAALAEGQLNFLRLGNTGKERSRQDVGGVYWMIAFLAHCLPPEPVPPKRPATRSVSVLIAAANVIVTIRSAYI